MHANYYLQLVFASPTLFCPVLMYHSADLLIGQHLDKQQKVANFADIYL